MSLRVGIACCMWHVKSCLVLFMLCCIVCVVHVPRCRCCASYSFVLACVLMCNSLCSSCSLILAPHVSMVYKEKLPVLLPKPHNSKNPNGRTKSGSRNKKHLVATKEGQKVDLSEQVAGVETRNLQSFELRRHRRL